MLYRCLWALDYRFMLKCDLQLDSTRLNSSLIVELALITRAVSKKKYDHTNYRSATSQKKFLLTIITGYL